MLPALRRPLKLNWWTIAPVLASLALWGGVIYAGAWTGSVLTDRSDRFAGISPSEEFAATGRH